MNTKDLTYKKIFKFWVPLCATWLMMSVEGPFLAAVIARMDNPKYNLAAYGVAFAIALIVEAPIIMILSASVALTKDRESFQKVRRFLYTLNFAITGLLLILVLPPVFNFIAANLLNLPPELAKLAHVSTLLMLPWPAAIGYRRLYQGLLIRFDLTRRVTYGTIVRLVTDFLVAALLWVFTDLPGAYIGTITLSTAVTLEALATKLWTREALRKICGDEVDFHDEESKKKKLTYGFIARFYVPLALSSILGLAIHPMVTFFMGKSRFPIESLAVIPVINALIFIFRSVGLSFLEVSLALLGNRNENYRILRNFATVIGGTLFTLLTVIAFTPLANIWFEKVSGLSAELTGFALLPLRIGIALPAMSTLLSFQRSILVNSKKTRTVSLATGMEVLVILLVLSLGIFHFNMIGAVAAYAALVIGRATSNSYQHVVIKKAVL